MISGLRDGWSLAWALAERFGRAGVRLREGLIRRLAPAHPFGASPLCGDVLRRPLAGLSNRRVLIKSSLSAIHKKARRWPGFFVYGGEGGTFHNEGLSYCFYCLSMTYEFVCYKFLLQNQSFHC